MSHDYQAIKRRGGQEIHAAGPDGNPACGAAPDAWRYQNTDAESHCRNCLKRASTAYAEGYADGYAVHLGLGTYDASLFASNQAYRYGAQDGRARGVDDHLAQMAAAESPAAARRAQPKREVRRRHANCPSCNATA